MHGPPRRRIDIPQMEPKLRSPSKRRGRYPLWLGASAFLGRMPATGIFRSATQIGIARGANCFVPPWLCHAALIFLIVEGVRISEH
jgi:hypothetical protein